MHDLYIAYDKFSCQYILTTFFVIFSSAFLYPGCHHIVGFSARILLLTPSFLSATYPLASGVGFHACFSLPASTTWVFPLASYSSRPVFSPLPINQLPGWVFTLVFLFLHPRRGFFRSLTTPHAQFCPPLPAYQLPGWVFSLTFLYLHPRRGFFRSHSTPHAQFSLRSPSISFRAGFSRLLFSIQAHVLGFSARILLLTPSFLSATYPLASWVGFLACFSLPKPTPWVFPLAFYSSRPVLSPATCLSASGVGFHACFSLPAPTTWFFPLTYYSSRPVLSPATCLSASGLGFLAYFSLPTPTPWVFPLAFYSSRPVFSPLPTNQLSGHVFTLANTRACKNAMRLGIPNAWRFINSKLILLFQLKGIHCRSTEAGMKVQSSSLLPRLQHRFPRSQPEILQSQAPYP